MTGCRVAAWLLYLSILLLPWSSEAEKRIYPPYPDIRGYEFPWGRDEHPATGLRVFRLPDGDYLITRVRGIGRPAHEARYHDGTWFFRGKTRRFTSEEHEEETARRLPRAGTTGGGSSVTLRDGGRIEARIDLDLGSCSHFAAYVQRVDADGTIQVRRSIYYLSERPVLLGVNRWCERNVRLGRDDITTQVLLLWPKIERLEDDTVLVWDGTHGNVVIRLDHNLGSRSELVGRSIFLVDWDVVERIHKDLDDRGAVPSEQGVANRLAKYLTGLKRGAR